MPKAHLLASSLPDAPLSVAAVSVRLGISPSTLRTWERRYGLGLGSRPSGTHRRYLPEDVTRLAKMVELIHAGVPTSEAASIVLSGSAVDTADFAPPSDTPEIINAARQGNLEHLFHLLESAIAAEGLVQTWTRLIEPALEAIRASHEGEEPGHAPSALLTLSVLRVLTEVSDHRPPIAANSDCVLVLTDEEHTLAAHVLGVALQWNGINTAIMATGCHAGTTATERVSAHCSQRPARLAVVMGRGTDCEQLITTLTSALSLNVLLVGASSPTVMDPKVSRVRTVGAAVEEIRALLQERTQTLPFA
ncbi:MerR family transcriptional regulator [Schaalia suimastitidis]|uniref:MerR family transcriptional regulator n=1 Tax=Schaalia suimastitidis TaxID=121163 RepID=UPI00040C1178|nr:MerR family transcriptional regulator [Schaalia suimastitidis]